MKIYSFRKSEGEKITHLNSNFILNRILKTEEMAQIGCFYLEANGVIGSHEAAVPQVLLVVSGEGFVRSGVQGSVTVEAGDAVFWSKGEEHETSTETGMTAIVVESPEIDPDAYMSLKEI
ncbi:cupin domain-containing protein [Salinicoccus sp. ID82-1]|uniref:cupin domain-containing protein n=1 Tax=Salinicoccus sp. ID82-1 TaxID=2820269 RepID=UPI001F3648FB|nr:cupin domain-containing protein [Salinicoccus sp. ID82-1]MCG1010757.1 cupin domain-containing protein [Salinicoccus sp. ID82-1]